MNEKLVTIKCNFHYGSLEEAKTKQKKSKINYKESNTNANPILHIYPN